MKDKGFKNINWALKITTTKSKPQHLNMSNNLNYSLTSTCSFSITWSFSEKPKVTGIKMTERLITHFDFYLFYFPVSALAVVAH